MIYQALLDAEGRVVGLAVLELSASGQRSAQWTAAGRTADGGVLPVGRAEAERIAREVLGFELPPEPALRAMLAG
ncbi:hypothetical protein [Plantactinospora sp. KBS50]|uniref:hypothetical protein n=1 Tax=Plantactinospora sp. KBS50 TaxID=2024580 RepID=UPI001E4A4465|nr:hypothetical protein [Plantactinospora sp. KBS50]